MNFTGERVVPDAEEMAHGTLVQHLERYIFAMEHCKGKRVLDAACGTGYGMELLSMVAREIDGMDCDKESVIYAEENYRFHGKPHSFRYADFDFDYQPFRTKKYDTIVTFETIEHLEKPHFFLNNLRTALADKGHLIWSIPINCPNPWHKVVYTIWEAKALIEKHFPGTTKYYLQDESGHIGNGDGRFLVGISQKRGTE